MSRKKAESTVLTPQELYEQGMRSYRGHRYPKALDYFKAASKEGYLLADKQLAIMKIKGNGMISDLDKGIVDLVEIGRKLKDPDSFIVAGNELRDNRRGLATIQKSIEYYDEAIALGSVLAKCAKAQAILAEDSNIPSSEALNCLTEAVEENCVEACLDLGYIYITGSYNIEPDMMKAELYFTKAYNLGYTKIAFEIGALYQFCPGHPRDINKAIEWFKIAAKNGDEHAIFTLLTI